MPIQTGSSSREEPNPRGIDEVITELYNEFRRMAERLMRGQPRDLTLQATALVHETYLKVADAKDLEHADRTHVLALAARAMRQVLVDHARARGRLKRAPPGERVPLDHLLAAFEENAVDLMALDEALERLAASDPVMARAVELHFFGGLTLEATAQALEIPMRTFQRNWVYVRRKLYRDVR